MKNHIPEIIFSALSVLNLVYSIFLQISFGREREKLIDRLMAKDLPEFKRAERIEKKPLPQMASRTPLSDEDLWYLEQQELARKAEREVKGVSA